MQFTNKYNSNEVELFLKERNIIMKEEYKNTKTKILFKCLKCEHEWRTSFDSIKHQKSGCPKCSLNKIKFSKEFINLYLKEKNIKTNSEYINSRKIMNFICLRCNHEWKTCLGSIRNKGTKCPKCSLKIPSQKEILDFLYYKKISTNDFYMNANKKMNFICLICNHTWRTTIHCIKNKGSGCPNCNISKSEKECRRIFEYIFKKPFKSIRPTFLKGLELDGYNDDLKLGFEYNGIQHYKNIEYFHKTKEALEQQKERDNLKIKICKENNINLIVIPYTIKFEDLYNYIYEEVKKCHL
jgi:DNA-directed RNA polymerase subunit RPC12/RpoP